MWSRIRILIDRHFDDFELTAQGGIMKAIHRGLHTCNGATPLSAEEPRGSNLTTSLGRHTLNFLAILRFAQTN